MKPLTPLLLLVPLACSDPLVVGSNVLWSSDHESGNLEAWTQGDEGGSYANAPDTAVELSAEQARSGSFSVKLTTPANGVESGSGLFRHFGALTDAYYSAWYFLPQSHETISSWTILRFRPSSPADPSNTALGMDLNLRSLPDGRLVLEVVHQRQAYLHWPLALPAPVVPIRRWFQIEARFRSATDESGLLKVWLDGTLVYDIENRVTNLGNDVYFSPCNEATTVTPSPVELYVDDVLVSQSRITPNGVPSLGE